MHRPTRPEISRLREWFLFQLSIETAGVSSHIMRSIQVLVLLDRIASNYQHVLTHEIFLATTLAASEYPSTLLIKASMIMWRLLLNFEELFAPKVKRALALHPPCDAGSKAG